MHNRPADADHTAAVTDKRTGMREGDIAVEPGGLHGNSHFARQFGCFARQF